MNELRGFSLHGVQCVGRYHNYFLLANLCSNNFLSLWNNAGTRAKNKKKLLIESAKSTLRLYRTWCLLLSDEITMSLLSDENICWIDFESPFLAYWFLASLLRICWWRFPFFSTGKNSSTLDSFPRLANLKVNVQAYSGFVRDIGLKLRKLCADLS